MAVRSEREKLKMQEKYQLMLAQILREEDNKSCVDCDMKNPRWASWNLGVFICIRCASFHRNLGVHISKVKSIDLDSWTSEQIGSMQAMGNSRARAVYEANLPDGFRRPHTDSALESFIRAKYERRKWIAKEWIPPEITVPIDLIESEPHVKQMELISSTETEKKKVPKLKSFPSVPISQELVQSPKLVVPEDNNTGNLLNLNDSPAHSSIQANTTTNVLDSLHDLFATTSASRSKIHADVSSIDDDLVNAFSSSNENTNGANKIMTNANIMALFNTSHHSPSPSAYPSTQHFPSLPSSKSLSFDKNLFQSQVRSTFTVNHHHHPDKTNASTHTNPTSIFTPEQLNTQFSQLLSFTNIKRNPSPPAPLTSPMSTSSDIFWQ